MKMTIQCADCGHDHEVTRKNAKYCGVCRLFRNLVYVAKSRKKCVSCNEPFAPLHVNDQLCSNCDFLTENNPSGKCAFCESTGATMVHKDVALCVHCAKDPAQRVTVIAAVGKKRQARKQELAEAVAS